MRRFTRLFDELDGTTRTTLKVEALERYFREAPPEDAAWALWFLTGRRAKRAVNTRLLREWVAEEAGLPLWLVEASYAEVGDLAETLALLLPPGSGGTDLPLHRVARERVLALADLDEEEKRRRVVETWGLFGTRERLVWHKLITGGFRVGAGKKLVTRALAGVVGVPPAVLAHRITGAWTPSAETWARITSEDEVEDAPARPYPFLLAHPLDGPPAEELGDRDGWQAEWKWDGIRAQLLHRAGELLLWSRGEELVTHQFPELQALEGALPDGLVLDGEILGWKGGEPMPFGALQRRLGRKRVGPKLLREVPVAFQAYDILERDGADVRARPLAERRAALEDVAAEVADAALAPPGLLRLSPVVETGGWEELEALREGSRDRGVEGFMLKRLDAAYEVGRPRGVWWKWKVEPLTLDAVMIYAQQGHGRRAGLHTDYTFGVWKGDELVPVAKAYTGLTDAEIRKLDRWIRRHTVERFGPVRSVEAQQVFELAFDGIRASTRHKSGVALRFPRMARWRADKPASEAATLDEVEALLARFGNAPS